MRSPKTMAELNEGLANIFAGAINGDVTPEQGRLALNAATRIIENFQAQTRRRALEFAAGKSFEDAKPYSITSSEQKQSI